MTPEERIKLERKRYVQRRYRYCLEHHECVNCRKVDDRTLAGHIRCHACNDKAYRTAKPPTSEKKAMYTKAKRDRRNDRAERKVCRDCGREDYLTLRGKPLCAACQRKRNVSHRQYMESGRLSEYQKARRDAFRLAGMCSKCGKNAPEAGHRTCTDCLVRDKLYRLRKKANGGARK